MADLTDLARKLRELETAVTEAAATVAPEIEASLRTVGREGKALRAGNAVAAKITAEGTTIHVNGIFTKGSKRRSWSRLIGKSVRRAMAKRLEG